MMWSLRKVVLALALVLLPSSSVWAEDNTELVDAVEQQDHAKVAKLLNQNASINAAQVDGMTALHWAVYHDDLSITKQLLKAGAKASAKTRYDVTPLSLACTNGNAKIVELLLNVGADANTILPGGETALMTAARTGKPEPVRLLIKHSAQVNATEEHDQTAMMWAAAEGHAEVVKLLIAAQADFKTPLKSGFTPMLFAVREGQTEVVKILIQAGADVKAEMRPRARIGKGVNPGTSALILAVENGHFDLAVELLKAGADPNDQRSGYSPLHTLTWVRKPNRGDGEDGDPAPEESGKLTSLGFVRELAKHGADVNLRLKRGKSGRGRINQRDATPFLMAADTADVPLMKLLIELGANPKLANAEGCTPLMAAAGIGTYAPGEEAGTEEEAIQAVKYCLKLGLDINATDRNNETAMHGAAYKNLPKMVEFLSENGADIKRWNKKNKYGWTPLLIAQGFRAGNFKPSAATIRALEKVMRAAGIDPPKPPPREQSKGYPKDNT